MRHLRVLLVNPWIHDFAAYDFWARPLGLLTIGAVLWERGCEIHLLDCLDRNHPAVVKSVGRKRAKPNGTGKFYREPIEKPAILRNVPRRYCRYGMPRQLFVEQLNGLPKPDVVLVTSGMTYWYPGVKETVDILRQHFGDVPIVLGGTYATLCREHAEKVIGPDAVVAGEGERQAVELLNELVGADLEVPKFDDLDALPLPAYDLYPRLESVSILTSRGCPYDCTFCASRVLAGPFRRRNPVAVADEIAHWYKERNVRHFAFFDDALFVNRDSHVKPILKEILRRKISVSFHTPNGVHPKEIDEELAELMFRAGFETIRLSYETSNRTRQREMKSKVSDEDLAAALNNLEKAGYRRRDIGVYVLMGLPEQSLEEVTQSISFVIRQGAKVRLACFSPIPGTAEWQRAVENCGFPAAADPLLTNNSIYPLKNESATFGTFVRLRQLAVSLNRALDGGYSFSKDSHLAERLLRAVKEKQQVTKDRMFIGHT